MLSGISLEVGTQTEEYFSTSNRSFLLRLEIMLISQSKWGINERVFQKILLPSSSFQVLGVLISVISVNICYYET